MLQQRKRVWTSVRATALPAHAKPISSLQFSRDGAFVASASADRSVKIWSTAALRECEDTNDAVAPAANSSATSPPHAALFGHDEGVNDVAWSHDNCYLVTASDDKTARIWDVETRQTLSTLGRTSSATSADTDPMGSVSSFSSLSDSHSATVFAAQFNPQCSLVATASFDETVRFWDVRTSRAVATLAAHHEPIVSATFNHDGTLLVTASYDGLARIWDVATRACLRTIVSSADPRAPLTHAQFTPNSRFVLVGALDSSLRLVDYARNSIVKTYKGHVATRYCSSAGFGHATVSDGLQTTALLVSGSEDGRVCLWDVATGRLVDELQSDAVMATAASDGRDATHPAPVIATAFHPHEPLVVASAGAAIRVWEQRDSESPIGPTAATS